MPCAFSVVSFCAFLGEAGDYTEFLGLGDAFRQYAGLKNSAEEQEGQTIWFFRFVVGVTWGWRMGGEKLGGEGVRF